MSVVHRNAHFLGGTEYGSREGGDLWFSPLISQHDAFAVTLHKNHVAPVWPLLPQNMPRYRVSRKYKMVGDPTDTIVRHSFDRRCGWLSAVMLVLYLPFQD